MNSFDSVASYLVAPHDAHIDDCKVSFDIFDWIPIHLSIHTYVKWLAINISSTFYTLYAASKKLGGELKLKLHVCRVSCESCWLSALCACIASCVRKKLTGIPFMICPRSAGTGFFSAYFNSIFSHMTQTNCTLNRRCECIEECFKRKKNMQ